LVLFLSDKALYSSFLIRWLRRNSERGQREVPARPGTMKRFRRHGHESQRDKHKQDLYQFNKVIKPTSSVKSFSFVPFYLFLAFFCFLNGKVFCPDWRETLYVIKIAFLTQIMWEIQLHIHKYWGESILFIITYNFFLHLNRPNLQIYYL